MSKGDAYMVAVSRFDSVMEALRRMLPFLCKKGLKPNSLLVTMKGGSLETNWRLHFKLRLKRVGGRDDHGRFQSMFLIGISRVIG